MGCIRVARWGLDWDGSPADSGPAFFAAGAGEPSTRGALFTQPRHPSSREIAAMRRMLAVGAMVLAASAVSYGAEGPGALDVKSDPAQVAQSLSKLDVWMLPQPKAATATGSAFDLARCKGIRLIGEAGKVDSVARGFPAVLRGRSGVSLGVITQRSHEGCVTLGLFPNGVPSPEFPGITASELRGLGSQGYVVHVDSAGVSAAATGAAGLFYASQTIAQIATDRSCVPGVHIRDWPSLTYRGVQYDVSRGQVPTAAALERLADAIAAAKGNMLELYIEDVFQWKSHPGISPPEAITAQEARELFDHAASRQVEVHPAFQGFGHWDKILAKPAYRSLGVSASTIDVRNPATVALVRDMVGELCAAFPGKFFNVDITENDAAAYSSSGTNPADFNELVFQYVLKLREMVGRHGMRLMVMQGPLANTGYLAGLGPVISKMPKDVVIGSYYTAMGIYSGWERDFPLLRKTGIDFFAQSWIWSHCWLMPEVSGSIRCSDAEVTRGLEHGALGSITCDWGDFGHFQLVGQTWYPSVYHAASAWTGAKLDRDYFNRSYCKIFYGTRDDGVARCIKLLGDINAQQVRVREPSGKVAKAGSLHYWEFWNDPFADPNITKLADPASTGEDILNAANQAASQLAAAATRSSRNRDNLEQLLLCAGCYQAMGRKLVAVEHSLDSRVLRSRVAAELADVARTYEGLREEFSRLWLAECKDGAGFRSLVQRFDNTISPCKKKAEELRSH